MSNLCDFQLFAGSNKGNSSHPKLRNCWVANKFSSFSKIICPILLSLRASSPFGGYREKYTRERHARGDATAGGGEEKGPLAASPLARAFARPNRRACSQARYYSLYRAPIFTDNSSFHALSIFREFILFVSVSVSIAHVRYIQILT